MQRYREDVKLTEAIGSSRPTGGIFSCSGSLRLHNKFSSADERKTFLTALHLDLNTYTTDGIFNEKVVGRIANNVNNLPSVEFLQDIDQERRLCDDATDSAHGKVA